MRSTKFFTPLLTIMASAFLFGVVCLFYMRFQSGDIYPVYSSLRSDPLGTKVIFEGLDRIEGVSAVRNYHPLHKIQSGPETAHLFLGMRIGNFNAFARKDAAKLTSIVNDGGRIVMTFLPYRKPHRKCTAGVHKPCDTISEHGHGAADDKQAEEKDGPGDDERFAPHVNLAEQWGVGLAFHDSNQAADRGGDSKGVLTADTEQLPDSISWHSRAYFMITDGNWNSAYAVNDHPVLIERDFGAGKIILATDTYFASNEAMLKERHPDLLSWLIGEKRKVNIDETHHGIIERPNIAALARKYRLHGLFAGLLFLAALFIWKNSSRFMPSLKSSSDEENIQRGAGDYLSGLVNLLRRNISNDDIVDICFREWVKTSNRRSGLPDDLSRIREILNHDGKDPVSRGRPLKSYESIHQILDKRRPV